MVNLRIRLDDTALAELEARAREEDTSVNALVLRFIDQGLGWQHAKPTLRRHDDLDSLAGTWCKNDAAAFERANALFAVVDPELWR